MTPKERPILFSTAMVEAILAGCKTMTRRVVADWQQPRKVNEKDAPIIGKWSVIAQRHPRYGFCFFGETPDECMKQLGGPFSPHGDIGDLLWVRETWSIEADGRLIFKADGPNYRPCPDGWKPSIHMPKKYARIWLRVAGVRVERLKEITNADAIAEGIEWDEACPKECTNGWCPGAFDSPQEAFNYLWDSINGKPRANGQDISYDANPWVWVVEFERVDRPQAK